MKLLQLCLLFVVTSAIGAPKYYGSFYGNGGLTNAVIESATMPGTTTVSYMSLANPPTNSSGFAVMFYDNTGTNRNNLEVTNLTAVSSLQLGKSGYIGISPSQTNLNMTAAFGNILVNAATMYLTNANNVGSIQIGQTTYTNLTGNVTYGGFTGGISAGGYDSWWTIMATNGSGSDRTLTLPEGVIPAVGGPGAGTRVIYCTNGGWTQISGKISTWVTNAGAHFFKTP